MIHELDILDIVSYFLEDTDNVVIERTKIVSIKKDIETRFASIEVCISNSSIERFAHKYHDHVTLNTRENSIRIEKNIMCQIKSLRSPYMEDEIRTLLKEKSKRK